jgi:hypothetical protein
VGEVAVTKKQRYRVQLTRYIWSILIPNARAIA